MVLTFAVTVVSIVSIREATKRYQMRQERIARQEAERQERIARQEVERQERIARQEAGRLWVSALMIESAAMVKIAIHEATNRFEIMREWINTPRFRALLDLPGLLRAGFER